MGAVLVAVVAECDVIVMVQTKLKTNMTMTTTEKTKMMKDDIQETVIFYFNCITVITSPTVNSSQYRKKGHLKRQ